MKTIIKISALILVPIVISCTKKNEVQIVNPSTDIQIRTDKNEYQSPDTIILTINNNTKKEYSILRIQPPFNKIDPYNTREILENEIWNKCPMPPFADVYLSYELMTGSNQTINDTIDNLSYWETGMYRLKYRFRFENADTIFYSNEFEISENL